MNTPSTTSLLDRVVAHYHRTFCTHAGAQAYLTRRGLTSADLLKAFQIGYADGSLLKRIPRMGELRDELRALGVITAEGRELLRGCIVVPIPDPRTGSWTTLYGRGVRTPRHCYLPGPLRGVLNFQAARSSDTVIFTEAVLDALSFHQAGIATAISIYGTQGCTADHFDLLAREHVRTVVLALDAVCVDTEPLCRAPRKFRPAARGVEIDRVDMTHAVARRLHGRAQAPEQRRVDARAIRDRVAREHQRVAVARDRRLRPDR